MVGNGKRLPVGVALGIVDVVGCRPMTREDLVAVCCEDYDDEMYGFAWELVSPREVVPVPRMARQEHIGRLKKKGLIVLQFHYYNCTKAEYNRTIGKSR